MKPIRILIAAAALCALPAAAQTVAHSPLEGCGDEPFICGRAWNKELGMNFHRLPERYSGKVSKDVWKLSSDAAGLSLRFATNSKNIAIKYTTAGPQGLLNMAWLNHSGVDLYATDANGSTHWVGNHMGWKLRGDTAIISFKDLNYPVFPNQGAIFRLYLPPYNEIKWITVLTDTGSQFRFLRESAERPVVVYGSSIVHGASPSRPGLMFTNIVSRETGYPIVNLGFSGSALMEPSVFDFLSEIDARAYILDPMPNCTDMGEAEIVKRATEGVRKLRQHSAAPILMVEACIAQDWAFRKKLYDKYVAANKCFRKAYDQLVGEGVKGLFYLPAEELHFTEESMIEGTHPNDIGNRQYADAYEKKLREMLPEDAANPDFPPITQNRDGLYQWPERHNEVIRLNRTTDPEILMIGNSITNFWGGEPKSLARGEKSWKSLFGKRRVVNMGFGWDVVANVYWRIFHGELADCKPRQICLMIGVNDIGSRKPEQIAEGVVALAALIRSRQPQARLHVLKLIPCDRLKAKERGQDQLQPL